MLSYEEDLLRTAKEILKLVRIMAEPALAEHDKQLRASLRRIVGKSAVKTRAALLMDGTRNQKEIVQLAKMDASDLSKFVKALRGASLLTPDEKPSLAMDIPQNFFEG